MAKVICLGRYLHGITVSATIGSINISQRRPIVRQFLAYRRSGFYAITLVGWVALTALALYVVLSAALQNAERQAEHEFNRVALSVQQKTLANESVLAGFAAFLSAVDSNDRLSAERYARTVLGAYPHMYMLEVAREVPASGREVFEREMSAHFGHHFAIRRFDYEKGRVWGGPDNVAAHWPLIFLYPDVPEARPLYGLDMASVPHLSASLNESWMRQATAVSPPFQMVEGDVGYVVFQPVLRGVERADRLRRDVFAGRLSAMLVIKTRSLLPTDMDRRTSIRATLNVSADAERQPLLFEIRAPAMHSFDTLLLPRVVRRLDGGTAAQPLALEFERQLSWADVGSFALRAVAVLSLLSLSLVMLYLRRHQLAMEEAEREHERAEYMATHDPLTQLPNRALLADRARQAILRWHRDGTLCAVFQIDLDNFKRINDRYGHDGGDEVLVQTGQRIQAALRATDTVARYGGDEFVVLLGEVADEDDARHVAEKLLASVSELVRFGDARIEVTCSVGIALCPRDGVNFEALLQQADHAMYQVKSNGRNGFSMTPAFAEPRAGRGPAEPVSAGAVA